MIIGHKKQQYFLKKIVESKKIPHALLFVGPEKLGKKTMAWELISSVFKENLFRHPDFILITPETRHPKPERTSVRGQIQIDQIRNLNWKLSLKPIGAPLLAAIIDKAHLMTREAQNCFLKTLEEPKGKTLLILITEHPNFLLPTILSRCQIIKFYPVIKDEIRNYLREKGLAKEKIEKIAEISLGRPGVAVDFLNNPQKLEQREKRIKELRKILNSPISLRFEYAKDLSQNQELKEVLSVWLSYFREGLVLGQNQAFTEKTRNILNRIQETFFLISTTNVNTRLALEILMMEF